MLLGPFRTDRDQLMYVGNAEDTRRGPLLTALTQQELARRRRDLHFNPRWQHLSRINAAVFDATVSFFREMDASFVPLPLTTRMISSPGAVYGKYTLDYTSDTVPITVRWFDVDRDVYLSESSQIYLELALLQEGMNDVYSIYNSFRRECGDATHLSEFHHIEYEGVIDGKWSLSIAKALVSAIVRDLLATVEDSLSYFLTRGQLRGLDAVAKGTGWIHDATFYECLEALLEDTGDPKYSIFTMEDNFSRWEEVRITEIFGSSVSVREFPLLEVPFYHAQVKGSEPPVADNADILWAGYGEIVGAGRRIPGSAELLEKASVFNLPVGDYAPYIEARSHPGYAATSGFGLGWERLIHSVLCGREIWELVAFPRTHLDLSV